MVKSNWSGLDKHQSKACRLLVILNIFSNLILSNISSLVALFNH